MTKSANTDLRRRVSELEEALAIAQERAARFDDLARHVNEVLWVIGSDGNPIYLSPAVEKIWACKPSEMFADPFIWNRSIHPEDRPRIKGVAELMDDDTDMVVREYRIIRPDGEVRWVRDRSFAVRDDDGRLDRIAGIVEDTSTQKRLEIEQAKLSERVRQAQKLESLGVLAGGIAHDFNNLLMGVLGQANLALEQIPPESPGRECLRQIELTAERAAELTNQMLAYSGKGKFVVEPLDLNRLVIEMGHLLRAVISKRTNLRYNLADDSPTIRGDASQLRQVVMNLITNASEALEDGAGTVTVTTSRQAVDQKYLETCDLPENLESGDYVALEISDTGRGMTAETKAQIFDPFFTTKFTGRGLGLAAVLGIVRGHGGAMKVYTELDHGTSFKILLPLSAQKARPAAAPAATSRSPNISGAVLVVDDDHTALSATVAMLEHAGFSIIQAHDGREGVAHFKKNLENISVVLLDMTMPNMSGEETFRELRKIRPEVRVVLTSGYNEQDAINRFSGKGLAGFIQKPYSVQSLVSALEKAVNERPD